MSTQTFSISTNSEHNIYSSMTRLPYSSYGPYGPYDSRDPYSSYVGYINHISYTQGSYDPKTDTQGSYDPKTDTQGSYDPKTDTQGSYDPKTDTSVDTRIESSEYEQKSTQDGCISINNYISPPKERKNKAERNIISEMTGLAFSDEIKLYANNVFHRLGCPVKRARRRNLMIFYCIYKAHIENGITVTPSQIATLCNIYPSEVQTAISMFSRDDRSTSQSQIKFVNPLDLIPEYCNNLGISEETTKLMITFGQTIINKSPKIVDETYPQIVAASVMQYYFKTNGIVVSEASFSKVVGRSIPALKATYLKISEIDNK